MAERGAGTAAAKPKKPASAAFAASASGSAANWRQTLWAMVAIQFVMTMAFSVLTPIMPLFLPELGVDRGRAISDLGRHPDGSTSLVAAFASPLCGAAVADRHGRKLMLIRSSLAIGLFTALMGVAVECLAVLRVSRADGRFRRVFRARRSRWSRARCRRSGSAIPLGWLSTGQLVGSLVGPIIGGACRSDRQLPHSVLLHLGDDLRWRWLWSGSSCTSEFTRPQQSAGRGSTSSSLIAVVSTPALLALFFVLLMAQFGVRTVQPIVTLYVQEMVGAVPNSRPWPASPFRSPGLPMSFRRRFSAIAATGSAIAGYC